MIMVNKLFEKNSANKVVLDKLDYSTDKQCYGTKIGPA